ncbi:MAG: 5-dehydro-2-deoxygluconokinase [Desulfocapsaceae bacterium]
MTSPDHKFDTLHMGRSSLDLYANEVGAPFEKIKSFGAFVGGSPTNISVGATRLGLKSALLTGVGEDPVGDFILQFLREEGVETGFILRKPGHRTSAVALGIEPPDKFPLVYYRDNCADIELTIDDVLAAPVGASKILQFAGTNLCKDPCRTATIYAVEMARKMGTEVVLDLDFRPDQWHDPRAFGATIRSLLTNVDIVIGTEDEINAAVLADADQINLTHSQISDARVEGDSDDGVRTLLALGPKAVLQKRGEHGVRVHLRNEDGTIECIDAPGYPVEIYNILGAGDAFGAGFLYGHVQGWGWYKSARLGNACGAIVVTRHGCANFMPTMQEVLDFVDGRGGF